MFSGIVGLIKVDGFFDSQLVDVSPCDYSSVLLPNFKSRFWDGIMFQMLAYDVYPNVKTLELALSKLLNSVN